MTELLDFIASQKYLIRFTISSQLFHPKFFRIFRALPKTLKYLDIRNFGLLSIFEERPSIKFLTRFTELEVLDVGDLCHFDENQIFELLLYRKQFRKLRHVVRLNPSNASAIWTHDPFLKAYAKWTEQVN